jgi:hypothetical protein
MTTQNSDFMALVDGSPPKLVSGCGPVKRHVFSFVQVGAGGGAGDIARLVKLPGGARVLAGGIVAANSAAAGASCNVCPSGDGGVLDWHQLECRYADPPADDRDIGRCV